MSGRKKRRQDKEMTMFEDPFFWNKVFAFAAIVMIFVAVVGAILGGLYLWYYCAGMISGKKMWREYYAHKEERLHLLVTSNQGITAVIRRCDRDQAHPDFSRVLGMPVYEETMIFSSAPYISVVAREHLTGSMDDYAQLIEGCKVEFFPHAFFVPFSSEITGLEWQKEFFRCIPLQTAINRVRG